MTSAKKTSRTEPGQQLVVVGDPKCNVLPFLRIDLMDVLSNGRQLSLPLGERYTRFEPRHNEKEVAATVPLHLRGRLDGQPESLVQILSHGLGETKARGHHSHNRPGLAVYAYGLVRYFAVGIEGLPPQSF